MRDERKPGMTAPTPELTYLMDANVLIALAVREHDFHQAAQEWLDSVAQVAVCPVTEGALVRFLLREGESAAVAQAIVAAIHGFAKCQFWGDDLSYRDIDLSGVYGHWQVTDSYLVGLTVARPHSRLATFDRALAVRHSQRCHLLTADPR
jgi:hypothetical protein